jgi:hypothetical protein
MNTVYASWCACLPLLSYTCGVALEKKVSGYRMHTAFESALHVFDTLIFFYGTKTLLWSFFFFKLCQTVYCLVIWFLKV